MKRYEILLRLTYGSDHVGLCMNTKLIICDEAPMTNLFCFEALDRNLRYVMRGPNGQVSGKLFGGLVIVIGGWGL